MKAGWKVKPLGDLCEVVGGGTPAKDKAAYYSGDIPWATVRDMRLDTITETECRITKEAVRSSATNIIPVGNVVIATRVGLGKVCLLGQDTAINQDLRGIIPRDSKTLLVRFLYWWLKSIADVIIAEGTGATVQGVKLPFVKSLSVPLPPLSEQERIVGILDEAFDSIAKAKELAEANLQNARALFQSHLQSVFSQKGEGWVEKRLDTIAEFSQGIQVGLEYQSNAPNMGLVRFIRIIDYTQSTDDIRYVKDPGARYWASATDIVMVRYGTPGLIGRGIEGVIANNLFKITVNGTSVTNDFLVYYLGQRSIQNFLSSQGSSTMPALTFKQLGAVLVAFPIDLNAQSLITSKLDFLHEETQRLESLYQSKLDALDELKKSLLHQAFSGNL